MAEDTHHIEVVARDDVREYSDSELRRLTLNLLEITTRVHEGAFRDRFPDSSLVCELHGALFSGVRSHAGRHRKQGFGSERLTFGPNRSHGREQVPDALSELFVDLAKSLRSFDENPDDPGFESRGLHVALWVHAKLIQIHPFEDGNGRIGRLLLDAVLIRLGLDPVPIEVPKQEYFEVLNRYYRCGDIEPLLLLYARLYAEYA